MFSIDFTSFSGLLSLSCIGHLLRLYVVSYAVSYNMDEVLSISPSANVFVFGDFNVHHKDWLAYSSQLIEHVNSDIIFLFQLTLLRWLTFLLRSLTVTLTVLLFQIYSFLLTLAFGLQWLSLHWEILIMLLSPFPFTFHQKLDALFHCIAYDYSHIDWDGLSEN